MIPSLSPLWMLHVNYVRMGWGAEVNDWPLGSLDKMWTTPCLQERFWLPSSRTL